MSPLRQGRLLGVVLLILLTAVTAAPYVPGRDLVRYVWFDACQRLAPRARISGPVLIVDVDGKSLTRHGQWPWPRTLLARLIDRLAAAGPAAIGLDIVMPEADRLSPQGLPALIPSIGGELAARLAELPSNDTVFAQALHDRPVVLGVAGVDGTAETAARTPVRTTPARVVGGDPAPFLRRFDALLRTLEQIDRAAAGHGLLNVEFEGRAVRRVPLVARVSDALVPTLALEMFRVASGDPGIALTVGAHGVTNVAVGGLAIPTQADASIWLRFARHTSARFVSAADVLAGTVDPRTFERKLVLVGVTALGLADRRPIPGGGTMDGVEIHAELIESLFDGAFLTRPRWAGWAESAFMFAGGILLILSVPIKRGRAAWLLLLPLLGLAVGGSLALYHWRFMLFDAVAPSVGLVVMFTVMLGVTLAEAERQRRLLRHQVELQREAAARFEGELSAARRIQLGILPKPGDVLAGEHRFSLHIVLEPAREVGGDLYDFFMLDRARLFFLLGDVSGKGLPGSLFMAVSKSLYKSTALRRGGAVATMMREANAEISRDNPEALFVTVFAAVLDVNTGVLEYCNAGHDRPYVLVRGGGPLQQLAEGGGPPLCVLDEFEYTAATHRLRPGDTLCLLTDGVTDARNPMGEQFGRGRLEARLASVDSDASAERLSTTIQDDVRRFVGGAEPADDLAILVVRWEGPPAVSGR
ncbi:MAG TPA: CHASE2 domain-containing protein [Candidatus Acidoferrum sp.]|nr:CHASE2 domain-containing protein [Candidatus Acidoferrum sp.]